MSLCLGLALVLSLSAMGQSEEVEQDPWGNVQEAEREAAQKLCAAVLDALGQPEGMDEPDVLRRFLRTDTEGHVWYVCLPKECDDTILAVLSELPKLTYLEAGATKITDAGAKELVAIKSLEMLHLWNTAVTDSGLEPLKELKELRVLSLGGTSVGDSGIAQLVDLKNLEQLRLNGTQVTDAVVEHLKQLPKLQRVWLQNTELTPEAVDELRRAFTEEEPRSATTKTLRTQVIVYHSPKSQEESPSDSEAETSE